jgi:hypothetical protein
MKKRKVHLMAPKGRKRGAVSIYSSSDGSTYYWSDVARNGNIACVPGEDYPTPSAALRSLKAVVASHRGLVRVVIEDNKGGKRELTI